MGNAFKEWSMNARTFVFDLSAHLTALQLLILLLMVADHQLYDVARRPFVDLAHEHELSGCLMYLDEGAAEVVSSTVGLSFLLGEVHMHP